MRMLCHGIAPIGMFRLPVSVNVTELTVALRVKFLVADVCNAMHVWWPTGHK